MLDPRYADWLDDLTDLMYRAHQLGLYRAQGALHDVLEAARREIVEVTPPTRRIVVSLTVGPVTDQSGAERHV
jgi:hypothetical protein